MHDFELFKRSRTAVASSSEILADKGYQGLARLHARCRLPTKKPRKRTLTKAQKADNRALAKERIVVEHVLCRLKVFKILAERYRNRRLRFGLRFNLLCAIYNLEYAS